ncbi:sterol desaturase family protein [Piscinibacter sp.]|uniref:sterol desaturase family protein n=1 Tax=Piscinibacter sp. TaxID=1903157 RepID=UPI00355A17ED
MGLFRLEHSKAAYRADFALYSAAVVVLAACLWVDSPRGQRLETASFALLGLASWTLIEYAMHRFVLHGLQPFRRLHAQHHERPTALICTPTILSATLIATLVFLPALALGNVLFAGAFTLGVLAGYLAYSVTHHATHHWRADTAWLKQRKRWHALHHHHVEQPGRYGVTSAFWDHVFGTAGQPRRASAPTTAHGAVLRVQAPGADGCEGGEFL